MDGSTQPESFETSATEEEIEETDESLSVLPFSSPVCTIFSFRRIGLYVTIVSPGVRRY